MKSSARLSRWPWRPTAAQASRRTPSSRARQWRLSVLRRGLAVMALVLAASKLVAVSNANQEVRAVVVAAQPIAAGQTITASDVAQASRASLALPNDALTQSGQAIGTTARVSISPQEVITPARLADTKVAPSRDQVVAAIPLVDQAPRWLRVGDLIDVYRVGRTEPVASAALVVDIAASQSEMGDPPRTSLTLQLPASSVPGLLAPADSATPGYLITTARHAGRSG